MIKLISLILLSGLTFVQCNDTDPATSMECPDAEAFTLQDFSGLDGCTWVLVKGDQSYEPINLPDFIAEPVEDQEIMAEIVVREDFASICLVGIIVEIICIK